MTRALTRLALSAVATSAVAPVVRRLMLATGTLDVPNHRSSHSVPVPRGGGLACLVGIGAGLATAPYPVPTAQLCAVAGLAAVGLADDRSGGLPTLPRLAAQSGAGLVCGLSHSPLVAAAGAVLMPGVVNVVNFMDGINGISGSTAAVWGVLAMTCPGASPSIIALGAVTAGAGLGFLPHNVPTAQLFLGDVGSYLIGALMGAALIDSLPAPLTTLRLGAPLLPYAADAAQALYRRTRRGDPVFEAHRDHIYQRMVDACGVSHLQMALLHSSAALATGLASKSNHPPTALCFPMAVVTVYLAMPRLTHFLSRLRPLTYVARRYQ